MIRFSTSLLLLLSNLTFAQNVLHGYVKDENGQPFQNTIIRIEQTDQSDTTDENGYYKISNIKPGIYALSVDYLYDKQYYSVSVFAKDTNFDLVLIRRIEFNEILIKGYQMDISNYSNANHYNEVQLQSLEKEKDIPYVLSNTSGIVVQSDAGNGIGYTGIRMRGMDPSHVQININGIPYNDSESSLSYFVDIPDILAQTQEVTILKGNVPNRAGTPSFGGAIDINTNKLSFEPFFLIKTQFGSFHSSKYSIQANSGLIENKYNFELGFSRQQSDGYIDRSDSDLKSFRFSGAIIKKNYSFRLNYIHGSERTGQAWYGLPIQYADIDSLRKYNAAGTEKPGEPYTDQKDNYKQDHIQLFYQNQLNSKIIWNNIFNYTRGSGYYEEYKASQLLGDYFIYPSDSTSDLVRRQWLENDFIFASSGLQINVNRKLVLTPVISYNYYNGDHFGVVSWVNTKVDSFGNNRYYDNSGIKKEFSACLKTGYKITDKLNASLDLQFRTIQYKITGILDSHDTVAINKNYQLFNPKLFTEYVYNKQLHFYSSIGIMQREPFREDLIGSAGALKTEELLDIEIGSKYNDPLFNVKINGYWMNYYRQLALSGKLNDVGEALRINLNGSYRLGFEFEAECKLSDRLTLWNASNFSINKISEIAESIPIYDSSYNLLGYDERKHNNSFISFSPSRVIHSGIKWSIVNEYSKTPGIALQLDHTYVSDFYLDNYSSESGLLKAYQTLGASLSIQKTFSNLGTLNIWLVLYNILDENYFSHGWISKFISTDPVNLSSDPYLGTDQKQGYSYYKGVYPQAFRHFSLGISMNFR